MYYSKGVQDNTEQATSTKRKRCTCSKCGREGHNANNKLFHPESLPRGKIASDRQTSSSAAKLPNRNCGEIDDEDESPDMICDEEDSDSDDDSIDGILNDFESEWGEEALFWEEDDEAHNLGVFGPIESHLPPFKGPQPGPHLEDALDMDPNDPLVPFQLFWPPENFEKMLVATNSYGRLYVKRWTKAVTGAELQAFLGLVIHIGLINHTGTREKLWENTWKGSKFCRSVMPYHRFEMIIKAWHYVDYAQYTAEEIKDNKQADPFWPVASLEEDLNALFRRNMNPGQCLDIDEQCIPWKGRHKCRCYNKSKPIKRHFKVLSLNDSRSGYQHGFYLYRGKHEDRPARTYPQLHIPPINCSTFQSIRTSIIYYLQIIGLHHCNNWKSVCAEEYTLLVPYSKSGKAYLSPSRPSKVSVSNVNGVTTQQSKQASM